MKPLEGKVAIVTGASRGIGLAIARRLAALGASVMLAARSQELLAKAVDSIVSEGGVARSFVADLSLSASAAKLAAATEEAFGGIDIVVNNAGATKRGPFISLTDADWESGFALKFMNAVRLTRAAWPSLKARRGSVVMIAGVGGRTPGADFTIGGSVNAAMLSFTKALADLGIADSVQVNAVNPGDIRTDRLAARLRALSESRGITISQAEELTVKESKISKLGEPGDIAALVAFIVSPEGRLLQGSVIDMDAGKTKSF